MRTCTKCLLELETTEFQKKKRICKTCLKTYFADWFQRNKEKHRVHCKTYREKNPEQVRETSRKYYEKTKEDKTTKRRLKAQAKLAWKEIQERKTRKPRKSKLTEWAFFW